MVLRVRGAQTETRKKGFGRAWSNWRNVEAKFLLLASTSSWMCARMLLLRPPCSASLEYEPSSSTACRFALLEFSHLSASGGLLEAGLLLLLSTAELDLCPSTPEQNDWYEISLAPPEKASKRASKILGSNSRCRRCSNRTWNVKIREAGWQWEPQWGAAV